MQLSLVPSFAVVLINICLIGYVLQLGDRTRSGFFLIMNGLALILWAGGGALFQAVGQESPFTLALPYVAALLVPTNFLYYSLSRPRPIRPFWESPLAVFLLYSPILILTIMEDYRGEVHLLFDYSYRTDQIVVNTVATRAAALYTSLCLFITIAVLAVRYNTTSGPEQNLSKHLIGCIAGPFLFAGFFWASSGPGGITVMPSPSLIFAIMAQTGLIVVLRQEEIRNPRFLSRVVYVLTTVLVAFILMHIMANFYIFVQGGIVMDRTAAWILVGSILLLLLIARFGRVERAFDRMLFTRAAEYRKLVEETRNELREARERLRRSERLSVIGELSARVAHEIKNPLGPIKGYTQMMREKLEEDTAFKHREAFLRHLEVISEEVENIDKRVRQFLDSARQPQVVMKRIDINRVVERCARILSLEAAAEVELSAEKAAIEVKLELDPNMKPLRADGERLEEAIFNLARNSMEALGPNGGMVKFSTIMEQNTGGEEGVVILVEDDGPGISSSMAGRLFQPFMTEKESGTGLGLSIVKSTVEAHGGRVEIRNRVTGGTEARIWLPWIARENPGAMLPKA